MDNLERDFLAGLLGIPDEHPAVPPPPTKGSKKCVALANVDTNIVEDDHEVCQQAKRKKKKTTTSTVEGKRSNRKSGRFLQNQQE